MEIDVKIGSDLPWLWRKSPLEAKQLSAALISELEELDKVGTEERCVACVKLLKDVAAAIKEWRKTGDSTAYAKQAGQLYRTPRAGPV